MIEVIETSKVVLDLVCIFGGPALVLLTLTGLAINDWWHGR